MIGRSHLARRDSSAAGRAPARRAPRCSGWRNVPIFAGHGPPGHASRAPGVGPGWNDLRRLRRLRHHSRRRPAPGVASGRATAGGESAADLDGGAGAHGRRRGARGEARGRLSRSLVAGPHARGSWRAVTAHCPHKGCVVGWNATAIEWQCPCHGSRFGADGQLFQGPATRPLSAAPVHVEDTCW